MAMDFEKLMVDAVEEAARAGSDAIEPLHVLVAATSQPSPEEQKVVDAVRELARRPAAARVETPQRVSNRVSRALSSARRRAKRDGRAIEVADVVRALADHGEFHAVAERLGKPFDQVLARFGAALQREPILRAPDAPNAPKVVDVPAHSPHVTTPVLDKHARDLTALARAAKLDPLIGRTDELKEVVRTLLRKQKSNPVLVGEAGVGKTAIVEGLALAATAANASAEIRDMRIVELSISSLASVAKYRGELEEVLGKIMTECASDPNLVLFVDEIHSLAGAQGAVASAADVLKPALARGEVRLIGATTPKEYQKFIERDEALERRLLPIRVEEPEPREARDILVGLRSILDAHHHVRILDEAIEAAVELSVRYLPDRRLPDKARDLLDQAAASRRFLTLSPRSRNAGGAGVVEITRDDVARVVADWTKVPVERLSKDQAARLLDLETQLAKRVVAQPQAVSVVATALRTALAGLGDPRRPMGVFLFSGPTGVGKTELAKAIAEALFDDDRHLLRFDMSEYSEKHAVSRLIGSPPGYVGHDDGGQLTNAIRKQPYAVVLFDEVEKAHPQIMDVFLQLFDEGRLTDSHGRHADFRNTVVILTSNLGANAEPVKVKRALGFGAADEKQAHKDEGEELRRFFRPELLNRIQRTVSFKPLDREAVGQIVQTIFARIRLRARERGYDLELAPGAGDALLRIGFDPRYGAREMERVMDRQIVDALAKAILEGRFEKDVVVRVVPTPEGVTLEQSTP